MKVLEINQKLGIIDLGRMWSMEKKIPSSVIMYKSDKDAGNRDGLKRSGNNFYSSIL